MKLHTFKSLGRLTALLLCVSMLIASYPIDAHAEEVPNEQKGVEDYTYKITPLLGPFNEYFFVETDNPDPLS